MDQKNAKGQNIKEVKWIIKINIAKRAGWEQRQHSVTSHQIYIICMRNDVTTLVLLLLWDVWFVWNIVPPDNTILAMSISCCYSLLPFFLHLLLLVDAFLLLLTIFYVIVAAVKISFIYL